MAGHFSPAIAKLGQKHYVYKKLCKKVAIIWGNFPPICKDWEKTNKEISSNLREIGRK